MNKLIYTFVFLFFFINTWSQTPFISGVCFGLPSGTFSTATGPSSMVQGDFNNDGKIDIALPNSGSNNVSVLLGLGIGSFNAAVNYTAGSGSTDICKADFNNDGKLDLAVANQNSNNISILIGNGNGTFNAPQNIVVSNSPINIKSADLNNDNKADLIVANLLSNNIAVLLGDGLGGISSTTNYTVGNQPQGLAIADYNNDGTFDVAVSNSYSNDVTILLGTGTGAFNYYATIAIGASTSPVYIVTADLNNDSNLDLVTANCGSNNLTILSGNGTGSFAISGTLLQAGCPNFLSVSDFNADGNFDIASANYFANNATIFLGTGLGSFSTTIPTFTTNVSTAIAVGASDYNMDGKMDIAIVNNSLNNVTTYLQTNLPAISIVSSNSVLCSSQSSILSVSGANYYYWSTGSVTNSISITPSITTSYMVEGNMSNSCFNSTTYTQTVMSCTGLEDNMYNFNKTLNIYPNPNNGSFIIESENETTILVTTILGEVALIQKLQQGKNEVNLSNQSSGLYFIKLGNSAFKIIKE